MKVLCSLLFVAVLSITQISTGSIAQAQSTVQYDKPYVLVGCQTLEIVEQWLEQIFQAEVGTKAPIVPTGCKPVFSDKHLVLDDVATWIKYWGDGVNIYLVRIPTSTEHIFEKFYVFIYEGSTT